MNGRMDKWLEVPVWFEISVFLIFVMVVRNCVSISSLTGKCAAQK